MSLVGGKFAEFSTHLGRQKGLPERPLKWPYRAFDLRESGLYYLQNRYYDPEICRFINADALVSTGQGIIGCNMFAYCLNNPVNCSDQCGKSPSPSHATNALYEGSGVSAKFEVYLRIIRSYEENGITLHHSIEGAILTWSSVYLPLSSEYEYVTYLYKLDTICGPRFFVSQTYKGAKENGPISPNVILGTMLLELQDAFYWTELVAMVHTHPNPPDGMHNDFPSYSQGLRGGDRWVHDLLNLPEMYIVPYKRCSKTPQIIAYSDRSTWCSNCK